MVSSGDVLDTDEHSPANEKSLFICMKDTSKQPPEPDDTKQQPSLWRHGDFMKLWAGRRFRAWAERSAAGSAVDRRGPCLTCRDGRAGSIGVAGPAGRRHCVGRPYRRRTLLIAGMLAAPLFATIAAAAFLDKLSMIQLYLVGLSVGYSLHSMSPHGPTCQPW
jgi:hypothetical protein